eukprot:NODE_87_length_21935_cov_0.397142.p11 type:complete len:118 gc:universal NODE_87_length_21935_cov_0.397142:965-1318(+)
MLDFPNIYILEGGYKAWYVLYGSNYNCGYLQMNNFLYREQLIKCERERKSWMSESLCAIENRAHMKFITPSPMVSDKNIWDTSPLSRIGSPLPMRKTYDESPFHIRRSTNDSDMMEF